MSSDEDIYCSDWAKEDLEERILEVEAEIANLEQFVAWKQAEKKRKAHEAKQNRKIRDLQTQLQELQKIVGLGAGNKRATGGFWDGGKGLKKGKTDGRKTMIVKLPIAVEEVTEEQRHVEEVDENITHKDGVLLERELCGSSLD